MSRRRTGEKGKFEKMIVYVDIDETICSHKEEDSSAPRDYGDATPIVENIGKVNALYDSGNTIVYWTARGAKTGVDWTDLTTSQLAQWRCKYHELRLDKPYYDLFIDDKAINTEHWQ